MSELPSFVIDKKTVAEVDELASIPSDLEDYLKTTMKTMRSKHGSLYRLIRSTARNQKDWTAYALAAALSFDIFDRQLEKEEMATFISDDDVESYCKLVEECMIPEVDAQGNVMHAPDFSAHLEMIGDNSPEFMTYLTNVCFETFKDNASRSSFIRGICDVAIPFFHKLN